MSGRGGIYEGPGGVKLYGDGREVEPVSHPMPNDSKAARDKTIREQSVALINGLRLAVNLTDGLQVSVIAGAVEKHVTATYEAGYAAAREDAARTAENEKVDADDTGAESDEAYNLACSHVAAVIRSLKGENHEI